MSQRSFLFVHSPLVGPSSLAKLSSTAAAAGHETALPNLTATVQAEQPHVRYLLDAAAAARSLTFPPVIVGHSGAGAFLPAIGRMIGESSLLIFVDAILPTAAGLHSTPATVKALLDDQTVEGILRPWLDWWPEDVVTELLPDPSDRAELAADMPRLPRSFYDVDIDVPIGWSEEPCGYLLLSPAYREECEDARSRGWPTTELDSTHLGVRTDPIRVFRSLLGLLDRVSAGAGAGAGDRVGEA